MQINNRYAPGQIVYLLTDTAQLPRMVTAIIVRPGGRLMYELRQSDGNPTPHYDFEISEDKSYK